MRVFSFVRRGIDLEPIEVEVSFVPGLPSFQITGLPNQAIKESISRIKSGLRHQGFKLPTRDQVLVHLKPSFEKKSSQGLDLAIAAAYLCKSGQIAIESAKDLYFYGELSLEGLVAAPQDLELLDVEPENGLLITGEAEYFGQNTNGGNASRPLEPTLPFFHGRVGSLQDLQQVKWLESPYESSGLSEGNLGQSCYALDSTSELQCANETAFANPFEHYQFGARLAELLAIAATGEHNVFVAGPAGTGKTTFSQVYHALLRPPSPQENRKINKISRLIKLGKSVGCARVERPYVSPHHSSSDVALLGGGVPPQPGEVTRAQHGMLVLDEYLEFEHYVKESLREPVERHEITVNRAGMRVTFPADFVMVGTTNLCPCGEYVPGREAPCGSSSTRCKSYFMRLSGPMLDRFEVIAFSHLWVKKGDKQNFADIHARVRKAQQFAYESRGQTKMNSRLELYECEKLIPSFVQRHLLPEMPASHRRRLALYRVALTVADLEGVTEVSGRHIETAKNLTIQPFKEMKEAYR